MTSAGWSALREGRWEAARAAFADALVTERTPEALEGLSWAAWWLDDAEGVFASREAGFDLYRRAGRPADAARMATWLAVDHLDFHGAAAVANGWLRRARRLLASEEPCPDHGWLAFHEGYVAHGRGDGDTARSRARAAAEAGRRFDVADLEMLGLALDGAVLVAAAEVEAGMRLLDEATTVALEGRAEIPISEAWTCCFLVGACALVRDYDRAAEWCDRIAEFAERYGSRYMLAFCRAEYGAVHVARGRWDEAGRLLEAAHEDFSRSRPAWTGGPLVELAELRRRQGRVAETERLLAEAGPSPAALLCHARVLLDRGDLRGAAERGQRVLRRTPPGSPRRVDALELVLGARLALGDLAGAKRAAEALREVAAEAGTRYLQATADLAGGRLAAARARHSRAQALLEDAADAFAEAGTPYEEARARSELATVLQACGRAADARREASAARAALTRLGAREPAGMPDPPADVTPREREVLALLAEGLTNREIASRLVVSEHTVHRHVTNILRKLGLSSRAAAAAHAVRSGIAPDA
jgi:ATP/maltotriose-dependent transcriptional regulator MalT